MAKGKAGGVSVRIDGAREARASLRAAGADLDDLKAAHQEIAGIIQPVASGLAPRGRTGRLAGSGRQYASKRDARVAYGGSSIRYAKPIHWGWPARHITAQPWLTTAVEQTKPRWTDAYRKAVQRILDRIKGSPDGIV